MGKIIITGSFIGQEDVIIGNQGELRNFLIDLSSWGAKIIEIDARDAGILTIGIGKAYGFVQHSLPNGDPPYRVAIDINALPSSEDEIVFDCCGTPTPIPAVKCLKMDQVLEIVLNFFRYRKLPQSIRWEEI